MTMRGVLLSLLVALLACSDSTGPQAYSGTFDLQTVNSAAVPASAPAAPAGCTVGFGSATLTLSDDVFSLDCAVVFGCPGMTSVIPSWNTIAGAIETTGGQATLRAIDPMSGATVDWPFRLVASGAVVTLPQGALTLSAPATLVFARQPPGGTPQAARF